MRLVLVADTFPPFRSSAAVQLRDLTVELFNYGIDLLVIIPDSSLQQSWALDHFHGVSVLRLSSLPIKDVSYVRRLAGEFLMPFIMRRNFLKSSFADSHYEGVIWYSPSIFHGPFIKFLKIKYHCRTYLIIRDIFPEWAFDMGLIKKGAIYFCFKLVASYQYSVADIIGVQTSGNKGYFDKWQASHGKCLEVLENWLSAPDNKPSSIVIAESPLAGRKVFVYAGNMGVAQGMDDIIDLAKAMATRRDIGFLFVGRGSEVERLKQKVVDGKLDNVLFHDEIDPDEIPSLYSQCIVGLVALDFRHKSHNIPGKFLTYMQCGLPVLANINEGNDLKELVETYRVGRVRDGQSKLSLYEIAIALLSDIERDDGISERCRILFHERFHVNSAVKKILGHFV